MKTRSTTSRSGTRGSALAKTPTVARHVAIRRTFGLAGIFAAMIASPDLRAADASAPSTPKNLGDLSIEQLMNESVTSVSKKETKLVDSAAAVTVITAEDIRRTGATSIPDALRMVPGLEVASINSSTWAVSSRGFNNQYGNKLLVLVDGRSVYTPSTSGVYWQMQDLMLEDLDRIEVIRGPGATLWGANAVNGVINITTRSAKETQGFLGNVSYGTDLQPLTNLRYGGRLAENLYYRVYGQFLNHDQARLAGGGGASDRWDSARGGLRLDWLPSEQNHLTLQGDYNNQRVNQSFEFPQLTPPVGLVADHAENHNYGGNATARWTHTFDSGAESTLQLYYDTLKHVDARTVEQRDTFDVDWQLRVALGTRHEITWGLGYRYSPDNLSLTPAVVWTPPQTHLQIFSAFVQDEIKLVPEKLVLTLGSKLEHNDYTGFEVQPSGRALWKITENQSLWAAVSRAVRTPNRLESAGRVNFTAFQPPLSPPILVSFLPTTQLESEQLLAWELGYRVEPVPRLAFDAAGFYNVYRDRRIYDAGAPVFEASPPPPHVLAPSQVSFSGSGETYGAELQTQWSVLDSWRLTAGYTWLNMNLRPDNMIGAESPSHQFNLRSYVDLTKDLELNAALYYVDRITQQTGANAVSIPSYVRLDVGLSWRATKNLELSIWGQNLTEGGHSEFIDYHTSFQTEIPRSVFGKISWRF